MGIATQDPELRSRLHVEKASLRVFNYLNVSNEELKTFARITGNSSIHSLSIDQLATTNEDIHKYTGIQHVGMASK